MHFCGSFNEIRKTDGFCCCWNIQNAIISVGERAKGFDLLFVNSFERLKKRKEKEKLLWVRSQRSHFVLTVNKSLKYNYGENLYPSKKLLEFYLRNPSWKWKALICGKFWVVFSFLLFWNQFFSLNLSEFVFSPFTLSLQIDFLFCLSELVFSLYLFELVGFLSFHLLFFISLSWIFFFSLSLQFNFLFLFLWVGLISFQTSLNRFSLFLISVFWFVTSFFWLSWS